MQPFKNADTIESIKSVLHEGIPFHLLSVSKAKKMDVQQAIVTVELLLSYCSQTSQARDAATRV